MATWRHGALRWSLALVLLCGGADGIRVYGADEPTAEAPAFVVPDGPTEKIAEFMRTTLRYRPPQNLNSIEKRLTMIRAFEAAAKASEKILAAKPDEATELEAIQTRLQVLSILSQVGRREAVTQLDEFVASLEKDQRPAVKGEVIRFQLEKRMRALQQAEPGSDPAAQKETVKQLAADANKWLEQASPNGGMIGLVMQISGVLEKSGEPALAADVLKAAAAVLKKSPNADLAAYAVKLEGSARRANLVGQSIDIDGKKLDGKPLDWKSYRGKVVLIDFWATWCGPCIAEMPNIRAVYDQFHERGFEVVGVSLDERRGEVDSFLQQSGLPWTIVFSDDEKNTGWDHPMAVKFGVMSIPQMILVDREGKVATLNARGEALREHVAKLIEPAK